MRPAENSPAADPSALGLGATPRDFPPKPKEDLLLFKLILLHLPVFDPTYQYLLESNNHPLYTQLSLLEKTLLKFGKHWQSTVHAGQSASWSPGKKPLELDINQAIIYDNQMLSQIIKNTLGVSGRLLLCRPMSAVTAAKTLSSKKRKIYESQSNAELEKLVRPESTPEQQQLRLASLQQLFFECGRDTLQLFRSGLAPDRKNDEIRALFARQRARLSKECPLSPLELINFVQIMKNMSLSKLQSVEQVQVAYSQLGQLVREEKQLEAVHKHFQQLWQEGSTPQTQIRSFCLIEYIDSESRKDYLQRVTGLVKHFKTTQVLMALYEKWKEGYPYGYEFIDALHQNEVYNQLEDVNLAYYKLLFLEAIKGEFIPNDDGVYNRVFHAFIDRPNVLNHAAFHKFVQMLRSQLFFLQTQFTRYQLETALNTFVNIAKNQHYDKAVMTLDQLVEIYLAFEDINSTGEILLNEITFFSKTHQFKLTRNNFPLYKQLLMSVLANIQKKIKYERRDSLNKSYTFDTLNFLLEFTPKYLQLWPEVILELNEAARELFPKGQPSPLLKTFEDTCKLLLSKHKITLQNPEFTLKILRFWAIYKDLGYFPVNQQSLHDLLKQFQQNQQQQKQKGPLSNTQLQILYLTLTLCEGKLQDQKFSKLMSKVNSEVVQRQMVKVLQTSDESNLVISLGHNIVWIALCSAKARLYQLQTKEDLLQSFVNKKLFYLLNSLQYRQVYQLLVYALSIPHIKVSVFERLLYNLSTFIIYIDEKRVKNAPSPSSFYLNEHYAPLYGPMCRLVVENKRLFRKVVEKDCFKVVQVMMMRNITSYSNQQLLDLLQILGAPEFLTASMNRHIQDLKFTPVQLDRHDLPTLRAFEYYNKSISRYFEGKYSQTEIKKRLREQLMDKQEIKECFSKLEVYKTIFMDGQLLTRFEIPPPITNITDYKSMFACERIFRKIKQNVNLDFSDPNDPLTLPLHQATHSNHVKINLEFQENYIKKQILQLENYENELRIPNRVLPKYIKVEVWKNYSFFNRSFVIDPKDLFFNKKLTDQILNKIVKGVIHGSPQKMREVLKEFSCREQLVSALREQGIEFQQHGAALQFQAQSQNKKELILLCSNNSNYKILYICAYYLQRQGYQVAVLRPEQHSEPVVALLKRRFARGQAVPKKEAQAEEIEEQE